MNEENKDALNNLINSIQEKMNSTTEESNESQNNSTSSFDISSLLNVLNNNNSANNKEESKETFGFDPTLLLKFQKIMSAMNSNSPQKDLLLSLKPFLRKSRQDKINEYLTILSLISILDSFKDKGSD
ncbi:MAG: hypothetical protein J6A15_09105 [Clostridia bacterium]|nr:hypothetical protein [Clostridia bacterium]